MANELTFAISADYAQRTGGYIYNQRLLRGLAELGWRVRQLTLPAGFPNPSPIARAAAAELFRALPEQTMVLADQLCLGVLPEVAAAEAERLRLVMIVHHPLALERVQVPAESMHFAQSERAALRYATRTIVTSNATARTLALDYAVPPERLIVAAPGVDDQPLALGQGRRALMFLSVGAVVQRKDHGALIKALAGLQRHRWRLVLVGSIDRAPAHVRALRGAIAALGLRGRVMLAGELGEEALARYWRNADVYVSAARHEGYGMAVAEAIAHGLPVVTTRAGAVGEWIGRRGAIQVPNGNVAQLQHALASLLLRPSLRASLRRGALARRRTMPTWERTARVVHCALTRL
jgi:glycosyltransferase involved in cell wall biosynthesis